MLEYHCLTYSLKYLAESWGPKRNSYGESKHHGIVNGKCLFMDFIQVTLVPVTATIKKTYSIANFSALWGEEGTPTSSYNNRNSMAEHRVAIIVTTKFVNLMCHGYYDYSHACAMWSLNRNFFWSQWWRRKRSRHSQCMRNKQIFCIWHKRPIG